MDTNFTEIIENITESLEDLNKRYANALVPLAVWLGLLAALGIFGNSLVIVVFSRSPEYRKNTNYKVFVVALAVVDLLSCITLIPADIVKTQHYFYFANALPCKVKCFFNLFGQIAGALVLLVICIDRYKKCCIPLTRQIYPERATKLVIGVILASFVLSLPGPILCGISSANKTNVHGTNTTVFFCTVEEAYRDSVVRKVYKAGLTAVLSVVFVAFVVMYFLIIKVVKRHLKRIGKGGSVRLNEFRDTEKLKCGSETNTRLLDSKTDGEASKACAKITDHADNVNGECAPVKDIVKLQKIKGDTGSNDRLLESKVSNDLLKPCAKIKDNRSTEHVKKNGVSKRNLRITSSSSSSSSNGASLYKTFIWIILTFVYLLTYFTHAVLSFTRTEIYTMNPYELFWFAFFFRIYFINNVVNPIVYMCLDKRFLSSCRKLVKISGSR